MPVRSFLITDIEGSTRLVQLLGSGYGELLEQHNALVSEAVEGAGGEIVHIHGDSFVCAFDDAAAAVEAALQAQRAVKAHRFDHGVPVRVRMGIHTGDADWTGSTYVGLAVHIAARISAAAQGGRVLVSDDSASTIGDRLPADSFLRDLGHHRLKDLDTPVRIKDLVHPDLGIEQQPIRSLSTQPHNLPAAITRFIGRGRELDEIGALLAQHRMVTMLGGGGAGKTRLALQAARALLDRFPDGVWLTELAAVSEPALVERAVARALGVGEQPGTPLIERITAHLAHRVCLLVIDNCEHVLDEAAAVIDAILTRCADVRVLATSREPLMITGEVRWSVPPLAVPQGDEPLDQIADAESVALFCDRARAADPRFVFDDSAAPAVVEICRRLDGIPLAIELAADKVRAFHPGEIARMLSDRFELLAGRRGGTAHHRSLYASLQWSYDLLAEDQQARFRALGVFAGPFSIEAARELLGPDAGELIAELVDRSLLAFDGDRRYAMLESVRAFAANLLEQHAETERARDALVRWAVDISARASQEFRGPDAVAWLDQIEADLPNLRIAMDHASSVDREQARRIVTALFTFWDVRRYRREGLERAEALLDDDAPASEPLAATLNLVAGLNERITEYDEAERFYERAATMFGLLGHRGGEADVLRGRANIAWARAQPDEASRLYQGALDIYTELGDDRGRAVILHAQAVIARERGDLDLASDLYRQSLALYAAAGDEEGAATDLNGLAGVAWRRGRIDEAREHLAAAIAIHRRTGNAMYLAGALANQGVLAIEAADFALAVASLQEAMDLAARAGDERIRSIAIANLGLAQWGNAEDVAARATFEQALVLQRRLGHHGEIANTLAHLGQLALTDGRLDDAEQLLAEALSEATRADRADVRMSALDSMAALAVARGDVVEASKLARRALDAHRADGSARRLVGTLITFARIALLREDARSAATLAGAVEKLGADEGFPTRAREQLDALLEALGDLSDDLAQARATGSSMDERAAIDLAISCS